jgi:hypothetical protein
VVLPSYIPIRWAEFVSLHHYKLLILIATIWTLLGDDPMRTPNFLNVTKNLIKSLKKMNKTHVT